MDPLDSTAILDRASQSFLRSSGGPAAARSAQPVGSDRSPSRLFAVRPRSAASAQAAMDNPRAMLARAQQVMNLATMSGATAAFRRQIAVAAYLAEMEAQREMARLQREALVAREWSA
jgi:hypothetical protein